MKPSLFNHRVSLADGQQALINTLSGAIDIASDQCIATILQPETVLDNGVVAYFLERGYLLQDDFDESELLRPIYDAMLEQKRRSSGIHSVFILSFDCNLRCSYCWQRQKLVKVRGEPGPDYFSSMSLDQAQLALAATEELQKALPLDRSKAPVVQLFGGEPLLPGNHDVVEQVIRECQRRSWPVQITTNGAFLPEYFELIRGSSVGEVQVTIDGPAEIHEKRRVGSSFQQLMDTIDKLIAMGGLVVKMRVNLDLSNLKSLPRLADEIISRQWYAGDCFRAYVAPLRDSGTSAYPLLRNRVALIRAFLELVEAEPKVEIFDVLGWHGFQAVRQLIATGRMPMPRSHVCEANVNQVVFTPDGEIHLCIEEAHAPERKVGKYSPRFMLDEAALASFYYRGPLDLGRCRRCDLLPICGGGCHLIHEEAEGTEVFCAAVRASFDEGIVNAFRSGELP